MSEQANADIKLAYQKAAEATFAITQALSQIKDKQVRDEVIAKLINDCDR
ncbi:hypothetical protein [Chlorogloeopsis sp. ULAP02]